MTYRLEVMAKASARDTQSVPLHETVDTVREARQAVLNYLLAGWRDVTAELVNGDGDIVAVYQRGEWRMEDDAS